MDSSVSPNSAADEVSQNVEFPVDVATLAVGGVNPEIGDTVDVKVSGVVTRVVNNIGYVKPTTINDLPLPAPVMEPNPEVDEMERLRRLSHEVGPRGDAGDY